MRVATSPARPAPRASSPQVPLAARHRLKPESFVRAGGRRLPDRLAAGRFLLAAVDPERLRVDAGRRVDVVRAGMRRTVIGTEAVTGQAEHRVPHRRGIS